MPKVSICIPTYRQVEYLGNTLESISTQSFLDYEVVITDDSEDNSVEELLKSKKWLFNVRYIRNDKRLGSPSNWNKAIKHASGEYIKILHHDEWFPHKGCLKNFVAMLDTKPTANFAFSSTIICGPDKVKKRIHSPGEKSVNRFREDINRLFPHNLIGSPGATIYRKSVNLEYDSNLKWVVDLEFYIKLLKQNADFVYCEEPLVSTIDGGPHQVTAECLGRRDVELFEWSYLYNSHGLSDKIYWEHVRFFWELFNRHRVTSVDGLREIGYGGHIPAIFPPIIYSIALKRLFGIKKSRTGRVD
jgi:glycosyltransferase involved in cell wall biosynthesis